MTRVNHGREIFQGSTPGCEPPFLALEKHKELVKNLFFQMASNSHLPAC